VLVLFDIDGTLLHAATDAHRDAMHEALRTVHGIDLTRMSVTLSAAGRTDPEIARAILLAAGVSARRIDDRAPAVREECCRAYARLCPRDLSHTVLPGIGELLEWLAGRPEVTLALVTGNYEAVARLKLARAGLGRYFPSDQGAFGSDAEDRAALPAIARRRAGRVGGRAGGRAGVSIPRAETIVIGDTPRDIACARADGVRCLAVTTGPFGAGELSAADAVVIDAGGLRNSLEELVAPLAR
jgi:phosphoglycolate phosphatase-like HAD superfamily hydrolase